MFEQLVLVDHPNIVKLHKYWLDVKDSKARVGARGGCRPGWEGRRWDPGVLCSPCSQDSLSSGSKLGRISSLKPIRHWHGLPRERRSHRPWGCSRTVEMWHFRTRSSGQGGMG